MSIFERIVLILLPVWLLLAITLYHTYNLPYYTQSFERYGISEYTGVGPQELERTAVQIIDYLKGRQPDLVFQVTDLEGNSWQAFEDRELQHMVDVRKIFDVIRIFMWGYLIAFAGVLVMAWRVGTLPQLGYKAAQHVVYPSVVLLVILFAAMMIDFNQAFTLFHHLFFRNDLWLLDPETDLLIQMLPLEFFIGIVQRILMGFGAVVLLAAAVLGVKQFGGWRP